MTRFQRKIRRNSLNKKNAYSLFNCNGCLQKTKLKGTLGLFPVKSVACKQKLKENSLLDDKILCYVTNKTIKKMHVKIKADFNTIFSGKIEKKIDNIAQNERIKTAKATTALAYFEGCVSTL